MAHATFQQKNKNRTDYVSWVKSFDAKEEMKITVPKNMTNRNLIVISDKTENTESAEHQTKAGKTENT